MRAVFQLSLGLASACLGMANGVTGEPSGKWAEIKPLASRSQMLGACRASDGSLVAVGERGHILRSTDGGQSWQQEAVPTRATLTGVYASAAGGTQIAVGHQGTLLRRSASPGATWERVQSELTIEANLLAVYSPGDDLWWVLGAYGLFLESRDDGRNWSIRSIPEEDLHLHAVVGLTDDHFLMVGEGGLLLETRDTGATWENIESPYDGSLFGGCLLPSGEVLLHGLRGHVFVGHPDTGDWKALRTPIQTLIASHAVMADGRVVLGAAGGYFLMAHPGDWQWQVWNDEHMPLTSHMLPLGDLSVLVCGARGAKRLTLPGKQ